MSSLMVFVASGKDLESGCTEYPWRLRHPCLALHKGNYSQFQSTVCVFDFYRAHPPHHTDPDRPLHPLIDICLQLRFPGPTSASSWDSDSCCSPSEMFSGIHLQPWFEFGSRWSTHPRSAISLALSVQETGCWKDWQGRIDTGRNVLTHHLGVAIRGHDTLICRRPMSSITRGQPTFPLWEQSRIVIVPHLVQITMQQDAVVSATSVEALARVGCMQEHAVTLPPVILGGGYDVRSLIR